MIDRQEINRALAKAIAYKQCGKHAAAELWAARLMGLLECAEILDPNRIGIQKAAMNYDQDLTPLVFAE